MQYEVFGLRNFTMDCPTPELFWLTGYGTYTTATSYIWAIKGGASPIVVDAGAPRGKELEKVNKLFTGSGHKPMVRDPDEEPELMLKKVGIDPKDVSHLILTHLHIDHWSSIDLFPNAQIIINKKGFFIAVYPEHDTIPGEYYMPRKYLGMLVNEWFERLRLVEDEEAIVQGIRVKWLGGHTPCNQAVIVETKKGQAIIPGDVVAYYRSLKENIPIGYNYNLIECYQAMEWVRKEQEHGAIVLPCHDPEVLEKFPTGEKGVAKIS